MFYILSALSSTYKCTSPNTLIVIYEKDMFDYSRGELSPDVLTVHRALDVLCFLCCHFHPNEGLDFGSICSPYLNQFSGN